MKFWVKTANVKRALKCIEYGIFEGVISNPGDVSLENVEPKILFKDLCGVSPKVYYQIKFDLFRLQHILNKSWLQYLIFLTLMIYNELFD